VEADLQPMNLGLATAKRRAHRTDRLGGNSWQRLRLLRHAAEEEGWLHNDDDDADDDDK